MTTTEKRSPGDDECLGHPEGWQGGELAFCCAPTRPGRRFCARCQREREAYLTQRIEDLRGQLQFEIHNLRVLVEEGRS